MHGQIHSNEALVRVLKGSKICFLRVQFHQFSILYMMANLTTKNLFSLLPMEVVHRRNNALGALCSPMTISPQTH